MFYPVTDCRSIDSPHTTTHSLIHSLIRSLIRSSGMNHYFTRERLPGYRPPVLSLHGCQPVSPATSYFLFRLQIVVLLVISHSRFVFARVSRLINPGLSNFKDLNSSLFLLAAYGPLGM